MSFKHALVALTFALAASAGIAQAPPSTITGTIVDASTKKPISDAVVTATSPSLKGERSTNTDPQGSYRLPDLPPGTYALSVQADGYKPYTRSNITLPLNRTIRINVELLPESTPDR